MHNIKLSGYRIEIQFSESVLVEEQINCATKILNAYIVYDLNDWPEILLNNFALKNGLFGATNNQANNCKDKNKYVKSDRLNWWIRFMDFS